MSNVNVFIIVGNLTRDVVLRATVNGTPTATYFVAVDDTTVDSDGTRQAGCDFIPVTTYGRQAKNDAKYLKKGSGVVVHGRLRSWWQPEQKRGGFNFEGVKVQYMGKPSGAARQERGGEAATLADPALQAWAQDYERCAAEFDLAAQPKTPPRRAPRQATR